MAITNSDGSIVLTTKVDTSGIKSGMSSVKSSADSLTKTFSNLAKTIALAFSVSKFISFSMDAAKYATQTEASVQRLVDIYGSASEKVGDFIDENARALGMSKSAAASFSSVYGNLFSAFADQETNAELTNKYLQMTAVVASKTGRTVEDVQERVRSGLLGNTEAIEDLGIFVNVKTIEMTDAFQRMADGRSWEQLDAYTQQQIRAMAILEQSTDKYGDQVADTSATARSKLSAAYQDFKDTWGKVINVILIPVIEKLTEIIGYATAAINIFMGKTGNILEGTEGTSDNIGDAAENQEELKEEIKETNKELKKTLAGFDEIQILSSGISEEDISENINNGISDINDKIDDIESIGGSQDFESSFNPMKIMQELKDALDYILPFIEIALVVIGLILLSAGNIPLGIGFIAAGAYLYSVTERSGDKLFDFNVIKKDLAVLYDYLEEILVVIGIILIFLGQIPLGIGFVLVGAVIYGVKEIQSSEYDEESLKTKLAVIGEIVSVSLVAIGVILLMTGHIPLGLGFLFAGYALLKISEKELDEGGIQTKMQKFFQDNAAIFDGVGLAMIVLGVLLLFTPVSWGIALGLIAGGSAMLYATSTMNNEGIVEHIKKYLFENQKLISMISAGVLILGIILCAAGVSFPLGIGLIAAGAFGLAKTVDINWGEVVNKIKTFLFENQELISMIMRGVLILGIILCITGVSFPLGIGLLAAGAVALGKSENVDWGYLYSKIKSFFEEYKDIIIKIAGLVVVLGIFLLITGIKTPLALGMIVAGGALLAAEEKINDGYLFEKIKAFFDENKDTILKVAGLLAIVGIFMLVMGIGVKLALGMIVAGGAVIAVEEKLNDGYLRDKIKTFFDENIETIAAISALLVIVGVFMLVSGVGIKLALGMILAGAAAFKVGDALTNEGYMSNALKNFIDKNWASIAAGSIGGIIVGLLLCMNGINIPLGLALISAGAALFGVSISSGAKNGTYRTENDWNPQELLIEGEKAKKRAKEALEQMRKDGYTAPILTKEEADKIWSEIARQAGDNNFIDSKFEAFLQQHPELNQSGSIPYVGPLPGGSVLPTSHLFNGMFGENYGGVNGNYNVTTGGTQEIILQIDGREFGRAVLEHGGTEFRREGNTFTVFGADRVVK